MLKILLRILAVVVKGSTRMTYQGKDIDFKTPWRRLSVYDGVKEYAGIDPYTVSEEQLFARLQELDPAVEKKATKGEMVMALFDHCVESELWQPTFVIDHPLEISPLTKSHRVHEGLVERFEPVCAGMEIGNAYSELNNPVEQLDRLQKQEAKRVVDEEAQPMDEDFIHAIDVGMPPTGGVGIGLERIVMLLTDQQSIRDILLFPTMKMK